MHGDFNALILSNRRSLTLNFFDLYALDEGLAADLLNNPGDGLERLSSMALEKLRIYDREYVDAIGGLIVRIRNLPEDTNLREIGKKHIGRLIQVCGVVIKASTAKPMAINAVFECDKCGETTDKIPQPNEKPKYPNTCSCGSAKFTIVPSQTEFIDIQWIEIQERPEELPSGQLPHRVPIRLSHDLVGKANPGDHVRVTSIVDAYQPSPKSLVMELRLLANNVETTGPELNSLEISSSDEQKIRELAKDPFILNKMQDSIAPSLYGLQNIKMAVALQLFGGVRKTRENTRIRGDLNILLVGDPGTGKSQLLQYVARTAPRGLYTMGRGTTAAGLTAAVMKDKDGGVSLEAGALVLSDQGVICIDEMDKMRDEDRVAIHPAMEQQIVSIAKAGIVAEMNARTSILAAANPVLGRYNAYVNVAQNLSSFAVTLLNRFDLIFLLKDLPDQAKDRLMAEFILGIHRGETPPAPIELTLMRKYISYAKRLMPKLSAEASDRIGKFYLTMRSQSSSETSPIAITNRQIESLVRLTEASARLHLREEATIEDAEVAINLMRIFLSQVGIDTETGEQDIDTLTGKPRITQQKLQVIISLVEGLSKANPENIVNREDVYAELEARGIERVEAAKLLSILERDGTIFSPRIGIYKLTRYG